MNRSANDEKNMDTPIHTQNFFFKKYSQKGYKHLLRTIKTPSKSSVHELEATASLNVKVLEPRLTQRGSLEKVPEIRKDPEVEKYELSIDESPPSELN